MLVLVLLVMLLVPSSRGALPTGSVHVRQHVALSDTCFEMCIDLETAQGTVHWCAVMSAVSIGWQSQSEAQNGWAVPRAMPWRVAGWGCNPLAENPQRVTAGRSL